MWKGQCNFCHFEWAASVYADIKSIYMAFENAAIRPRLELNPPHLSFAHSSIFGLVQPANIRRRPDVGLVLAHRLRR